MEEDTRHPYQKMAREPGSGRTPRGQFAPGGPGGPGRPKKARIKDAIEGLYGDKPTEFMYEQVADGLGIEREEVPEFGEVQGLQVWVFAIRALRGSHEHVRELLDRTDPKPSRATIEIRTGRGPVQTGDVDADEALAYYRLLGGNDEDD